MQILRGKRIDIKPGFFIMIALYLLLFPMKWVIAWLLAAVFHELCHCLVLAAHKVRIFSVKIDFNGTTIETEYMKPREEFLSALAGPLGGCLLMIFSNWFPRIAACALVQAIYNLLPVYPLDGGRVLRCCIFRLMDAKNAVKICKVIEMVILLIVLIVAAVAGLKWHLGLLPFVCALLLIRKSGRLKIPCKQRA